MRKFKLIKKYPGSPKLGTVLTPKVDKGNGNTNNFYWEGSWFNPNEFTEYWEEVIEPTFQIMSFTATNVWKGKTANLLSNGHYSINPNDNCGWTLREMLEVGNCVKNGEVQIHSVKRLSDGEIFTIGDRAKTITSKGSHNIRQFIIRQRCNGTDANGYYIYDGIDAMWVNWEENCGGNWLDSTEKVKQPILTTEDGVPVYSYNSVQHWVIDGTYEYALGLCKSNVDLVRDSPETYKLFSTEAAAREYVKMNIPCLSLADIKIIGDEWGHNRLSYYDTALEFVNKNNK